MSSNPSQSDHHNKCNGYRVVRAYPNSDACVLLQATRVGQAPKDNGANLDLQIKNGCTALMIACNCYRSKEAKLLIESGANLDLQRVGIDRSRSSGK